MNYNVAYRCEICDYEASDSDAFKEHRKSKKHYFKERDSRTICITSGFADCMDSLRMFLATFGKIAYLKLQLGVLEVIFREK